MSEKKFHSGFVAILGRPNVGKSSILNRFVGEKVAIVSDRPQTTRNKLMGIVTREDWQIVFVDTPGIHKPKTKLGESMMKAVSDAKEGVDAVLCMVDAQMIGAGDMAVIQDVLKMNCPKFLVVNKADLVPPEKLLPELAKLHELAFDEIVVVSARRGDNVEELLQMMAKASTAPHSAPLSGSLISSNTSAPKNANKPINSSWNIAMFIGSQFLAALSVAMVEHEYQTAPASTRSSPAVKPTRSPFRVRNPTPAIAIIAVIIVSLSGSLRSMMQVSTGTITTTMPSRKAVTVDDVV